MTQLWSWNKGVFRDSWAKVIRRAGVPGLKQQRSLPQEAHIPDGLILQLWPKQRVQLGQDGDEPEEVTADSSGYQHGDDHSAMEEDVRSGPGMEPAPSEGLARAGKELLVSAPFPLVFPCHLHTGG